MTSFLYSVSYPAHSGAIVPVFFSGLRETQDRGGHKTVMHRKATAQHKSSIKVFFVQMCEKLNMLAVRAVTTVAPRCIAGQDR